MISSTTTITAGLCLIICFTGIIAQDSWETSSWEDDETTTATPAPAPSPDYEQTSPAKQDATYIIKKGDTLWDLAFQFLGDPFLWPQIWQANSYISNPDLIYPGDRLEIPGRELYPSATGENDTFYSETSQVLDATDSLKNTATDEEAFSSDSILISLIKRKDVLSTSYLAALPFLWFEKDKKGNIYPGDAVVDPPPSGAAYQLYSIVTITPFKDATYHENDTVSIYSSIRIVRFNNKPANLIQRSGLAVIKKIGSKKIDALLFEMSNTINGNERIMKVSRPEKQIIDTLVDPSEAISGNMLCRVEQTQSPHLFQKIILDIGSTQGVAIGDVFGIYHTDKDNPPRLNVIGMIGHVGTGSSTLNMMIMKDHHIEAGDRAILLRRAKMESPVPIDENDFPIAR